MKTVVPTSTVLKSHSTSGMYMRMQPWETEYPMEAGLECRMPTPGDDRPIQRVPSGLFGPGGIGFWPSRPGELGDTTTGSAT